MTLDPANTEAWSAWQRCVDQLGAFPVGDKGELHYYIRAEALCSVLGLMDAADPVETYDRVMMIHSARKR